MPIRSTFLRHSSLYQAPLSRMVEAALRRWIFGRLAYCWMSLASSASRLAISAESCALSNTGAGGACTVGLTASRLTGVFCCCGARVASAAFGASWRTAGCAGAAGGVTRLTWVSWNGACSVVFGAALCSRVPLPCWLSWARKSASFGFSSLLKVDRVISRVLLIWLGSARLKPRPRISAACSAAARNRVKPSRSAGRTPAAGRSTGGVAAFMLFRVGSGCRAV
ncbi:hypothetical protein D3C85_1091990 [compost metagenome]